MKSLKFISALMLALLLLTEGIISTAYASDKSNWKPLRVVNLTGYSIKELYLSTNNNPHTAQNPNIGFRDNQLSKELLNGGVKRLLYDPDWQYLYMVIRFFDDREITWLNENRVNLSGNPLMLIIYYNPAIQKYTWNCVDF